MKSKATEFGKNEICCEIGGFSVHINFHSRAISRRETCCNAEWTKL